MAGTFRLRTNQSHTRYEGKFARRDKNGIPRGQQRVTYYGDGHANAPIGGHTIELTNEELDRFGHKARKRFELVTGKWHDEIDKFDAEADNAPPAPDEIDILLAKRIEDIVELLDEFDADKLEDIRDREDSEVGKHRKGVFDAIDQAVEDLG